MHYATLKYNDVQQYIIKIIRASKWMQNDLLGGGGGETKFQLKTKEKYNV